MRGLSLRPDIPYLKSAMRKTPVGAGKGHRFDSAKYSREAGWFNQLSFNNHIER
jgi:hypothetical protein